MQPLRLINPVKFQILKCGVGVVSGTALGWVPWVPVNPWISRIFAEEPMKFDIKSDPSRIVNPWIEISNAAPDHIIQRRNNLPT